MSIIYSRLNASVVLERNETLLERNETHLERNETRLERNDTRLARNETRSGNLHLSGTVFPFSRFYWNSLKFLYHLSTLKSARLLVVILPRKNAKDLKDGGRLFIVTTCFFARR